MTIADLSQRMLDFVTNLANKLPDPARDQARQTKQVIGQRRKDQARGRFPSDAAYFEHLVATATQANPVATATQANPVPGMEGSAS